MPGDAARDELSLWLDRLIAGRVPPEIQLDLIEAATKRAGARFPAKARAIRIVQAQRRPAGRRIAKSLSGGDAQRGLSIFKTKAAARMRSLPQGQRARGRA